ncbi:coenzyme F390 synthetase [Methanohalophilus levihalophilus]|uniref:coenzyme F390 synthetase n=1 Tax=Methanohalophilus levihalophilus TaxID=1431282 RepID=UPI001AE45322|nr:coenzyme F390 synthetase [Methanohalophilus levihalophilus]MBP2030946.1 coenzyme F390 synthetase [Methanohalophilus levihalophilus]
MTPNYYNPGIETISRDELDATIEDKISYTIKYAAENSPFYRKWFERHNLSPSSIKSHEDLLELPIVSGELIKNNQPPKTNNFNFLSSEWNDIFTIHETSGTSGTPKSFFFTWQDWMRYAEKYARSFTSQGIGKGDRMIMCASYGMNIGANTMTLAARDLSMTIIPEGKCTFPTRIIENYKPTGIVASVFKLLRLARRLEQEGIDPKETSIEKLVVGGEGFADESRKYLEEIWDCPVYNTYGSTEGTMCGECEAKNGLHVPEDLVHLDIYDPEKQEYTKDGECGRMILTTLLSPGEKCGTLLINYDTEDATTVLTRKKCDCGRTHMRIMNPEREAETFWIANNPFSRVDVERGVFQRENMEYLTGEYESFLYGKGKDVTSLKVVLECLDKGNCDRELVGENFLKGAFEYKPSLQKMYDKGKLTVDLDFVKSGEIQTRKAKGRPIRIADYR